MKKNYFAINLLLVLVGLFYSPRSHAQGLGPNLQANFTRSNAAYEIAVLFNNGHAGSSTVSIADSNLDPSYSLYDDYMVQDGISAGCSVSGSSVYYCPNQNILLNQMLIFAARAINKYNHVPLATQITSVSPQVVAQYGTPSALLFQTAINNHMTTSTVVNNLTAMAGPIPSNGTNSGMSILTAAYGDGLPSVPQAVFTLNSNVTFSGSTQATVAAGGNVQIRWFIANASVVSSKIQVGGTGSDDCGDKNGAWIINSGSGIATYPVVACMSGVTFSYTVNANLNNGGTVMMTGTLTVPPYNPATTFTLNGQSSVSVAPATSNVTYAWNVSGPNKGVSSSVLVGQAIDGCGGVSGKFSINSVSGSFVQGITQCMSGSTYYITVLVNSYNGYIYQVMDTLAVLGAPPGLLGFLSTFSSGAVVPPVFYNP